MRKKSNNANIIGIVVLLLGILPLVFSGMKVVSYNVILGTIELTGFEAAFGTDDIDANFLVMLGYILPLISGILALIAALSKDLRRLLNFLAMAGFVASAILLFMIPQLLAWNLGDVITIKPKMLDGVIFAVIPSILGAIIQTFLLIKK